MIYDNSSVTNMAFEEAVRMIEALHAPNPNTEELKCQFSNIKVLFDFVRNEISNNPEATPAEIDNFHNLGITVRTLKEELEATINRLGSMTLHNAGQSSGSYVNEIAPNNFLMSHPVEIPYIAGDSSLEDGSVDSLLTQEFVQDNANMPSAPPISEEEFTALQNSSLYPNLPSPTYSFLSNAASSSYSGQPVASSSSAGYSASKFVGLKDMIPGAFESFGSDIHLIHSLDQSTLEFGGDRCGFHALKNALCALAIVKGYDVGPRTDLFLDEDLYSHIEILISSVRGNNDQLDASDPQLRAAWKAIVEKKENPFPGSTPADWQINDLSIFHVGEDFDNGKSSPSLKVTDETSLVSFVNLKQVAERTGPFNHVFIVGAEGHWTTLIYEKDENQNESWYGLNSRHNNQMEVFDNIPTIKAAMEDIHQKAYQEYHSSIGFDLQRRCENLIPNGRGYDLSHPDYIEVFFDSETMEPRYLSRIHAVAQFMIEMGWINPNSVQYNAFRNDINNLRMVLEVYRPFLSESPLFKEADWLLNHLR